MRCPIATIEEFYAHALAIEREAAERYEEFEAWFSDRGADVLAGLCHNLAVLERSHLAALLAGEPRPGTLPVLPGGGYRWLEAGSPEAAARELFYRVASERHLMEIALHAEKKAQRFFEWVAEHAPSEPVRTLARELAQEEAEHVRWVSTALQYAPVKPIDWEKVLDRATGPVSAAGRPPARR